MAIEECRRIRRSLLATIHLIHFVSSLKAHARSKREGQGLAGPRTLISRDAIQDVLKKQVLTGQASSRPSPKTRQLTTSRQSKTPLETTHDPQRYVNRYVETI
jgi:hypothetical protein